MILRRLTRDEAARHSDALGQAAADEGWSLAQLEACTEIDGQELWIVADLTTGPETPVGYLAAKVVLDELEVLSFAVTPLKRRRGVGQWLLANVLEEWKRRGGTQVFLEVRVSNASARRLYERLGFVETGRRARYYRDGEDAVAMRWRSDSEGKSLHSMPAMQRAKEYEPAMARDAAIEGVGKTGLDALREVVRCDAQVCSNLCEGGTNWRLRMRLPSRPVSTRPGQFLMLIPGGLEHKRSFDPLLPRPMAIYRTLPGNDGIEVEVRYKVVGRGTSLLADHLPGERVGVVGPLGNGFPEPAEGAEALIVAGGTGVASVYELAAHAADKGRTRVLIGARTREHLGDLSDFEALSVEFQLATEDGSAGHRGLVTELLERALGESSEACCVYACGPTPMMRVAADLAAARTRRCFVSLENPMACGFGVCLGCAAPKASGGYALVCKEGPIFDARDIAWEALQ